MEGDIDNDFNDIFGVEEISGDILNEFENATKTILSSKLSKYEVSLQNHPQSIEICKIDKSELQPVNAEKAKDTAQEEFFKMLEVRKKQNIEKAKRDYKKLETEKRSFFSERKSHQKQFFSTLSSKFKTAKSVMKKNILQRKKLFKENYGDLVTIKPSTLKKRKFILSQSTEKTGKKSLSSVIQNNEFLTIKLHFLVGIKNKLPYGRYVLLFSIKSDLTSSDSLTKPYASIIFTIRGKFNHNFIDFTKKKFSHSEKQQQERISIPVPGYLNRRPYLNLNVSLVQIKGEYPGLCCGWGVFPLLNRKFEVNNGSFVCPILRGFKNEKITKYSDLHHSLKSDLDNWLGNLYLTFERKKELVDIEKLQRETDIGVFLNLGNEFEKEEVEEDDEEETGKTSANSSKKIINKIFKKKKDKKIVDEKNSKKTIVKIEKKTDMEKMGEDEIRKSRALEDENNYLKNLSILRNSTYHVLSKEDINRKKLGFNISKILQFIFISLFTDLRSKVLTSLFFFFVTYFGRLYVHYFSKYVYLVVLSGKNVGYYPSVFWVTMSFQIYDQFSIIRALILMAIGNFSNFLLLFIFIIFLVFVQKVFKRIRFPLAVHVFVIFYFVNFFLDDVYNFIFDAIFGNLDSNNFVVLYKLFDGYLVNYMNGIWGIMITVSFYSWIFLLGFLLLYFYLLRVYRGGTIFDVYERLNEQSWFIPMDHEVSIKELLWTVERAKKFRGKNGEKRRTKVFRIIEKDINQKDFENYYLLVRIYDVNKLIIDPKIIETNKRNRKVRFKEDEIKEEEEIIYRQFLLIPNQRNVIVELFDERELGNYLKNYKEENV